LIHFQNDLPDQPNAPHVNNELSSPHETNLHLHGLFVSGELPSDDAKLVIKSGESYNYEIRLPEEHMPGTHWYHPHRHGSTSFQLSTGAAGLVIVEDPPGYLPEEIAAATGVLLLVEAVDWEESSELAQESGASSDLFRIISPGSQTRAVIVNGQLRPTLTIDRNQWMRFRIANAGWEGESFDLTIDGCEMNLLAKDGVYIPDVPGRITAAHVFLGGRADVLVLCPSAGTFYLRNRGQRTVMDIVVSTSGKSVSTSIAPWSPTYPSYLQDLQNTPASDGCSCLTKVGTRSSNARRDDSINGKKYQARVILHSSYLGAVVQRELNADRHPYHQHTYLFQIVSIQSSTRASDPGYIRPGGWYDSWKGHAIVRYQPQMFATKVMIHCHILEHEDEGMMAMEVIKENATCTCDGFGGGGQGNFDDRNQPDDGDDFDDRNEPDDGGDFDDRDQPDDSDDFDDRDQSDAVDDLCGIGKSNVYCEALLSRSLGCHVHLS